MSKSSWIEDSVIPQSTTLKPDIAESIPRIVYTPGEPVGIGPDLCVLLAQDPPPCEWIAVCDPDLISRRAEQLGIPIELRYFDDRQPPQVNQKHQIKVLPVKMQTQEQLNCPDPANSPYVLETLSQATRLCLDARVSAMMTGPVDKGIVNDAGIKFSGHTEYLADLTGGCPVMMLATPGLRVALATTHIPVQEISAAITESHLATVLSVLHQDLNRFFGIQNPRILVCGLNPHAGEKGHLGREEIEVIQPVLDRLRDDGLRLTGPLPADTLFTPKYLEHADAVMAMYHDQGLPVLKYAGFGKAVNITLGLPIIRTSVDHGTAIDLAGTGKISIASAQYALQVALEMSRNQIKKPVVPTVQPAANPS